MVHSYGTIRVAGNVAEVGGSIGHDVRIRLTGRFRIEVNGKVARDAPLSHLGKVALGFLATERTRSVPRDELADVPWGGRPHPTWPHALRGVVHERCRRTLAEERGRAGPADGRRGESAISPSAAPSS